MTAFAVAYQVQAASVMSPLCVRRVSTIPRRDLGKYQPTLLNGNPVSVEMHVTVNFVLGID